MVLKKNFRQDLYFRLNVARIQLPPLRDRKEDIECLINYYLNVFNQQSGCRISGFTTDAWELMLHYDWPGNIRELKNVLEAIYIDPPANRISIQDLPNFIRSIRESEEDIPLAERELLLSTLHSVHWNKSKAAEKLQWSRMTLYRKMEKYQIIDIK
jgi:DNA-binding NtrC family response regulator